jgi:hypothetical protein
MYTTLTPILVLAAVYCADDAAATVAQSLQLQVDKKTGSFEIAFAGQAWLTGSEYRLGKMSSANGGLALVDSSQEAGKDVLGEYSSTTLSWSAKDSQANILMQTTFREYQGNSSFIVFEQFFPSAIDRTMLSDSQLAAATLFPSFARHKKDLPCFSYHGTFPKLTPCTLATYKDSPDGGVPLVIYDSSERDLPMTVFSALNQPMAHHMASSDSFFGAGVKATVDSIPAGWRQLFILSAGAGINDGMKAWGDHVLMYTGKARVDNRYLDDVHGSIGFWTDNGGYYHYSIGDNKSLGKNYEEVLPKVKAYHDELGVPFKHWQFDSWFYPKDAGVDAGGGGGAVTNWTALPSVFPSGMAKIQTLLGLPIVMHNRQWSTTSDYVHNWTDIEWYMSKAAAVPKDPVKFFDRFFTQQEGWGLAMYEQDWMVTEEQKVEALQTNISMGDLWLYGMAEGAARSGRTVQYCMPLPNQILSSSYLPAVTNARATDDYFHGRDQWAVGQTSLFYWALNLLPFKDGFYSSSSKQEGGQTVGPETDPDREALMATLSAAMVGPMDGIYLLNKSRVMSTCRKDGKILKPDRPLTVTDACFRARNPTCKVYETFSYLEGYGTVHYYFNNNGSAPLLADEVYLAEASTKHEYAVYNWYTGHLGMLHGSNVVTAGYEGHTYALVAPIHSGWIFVGEPDKYVSSSGLRFSSLKVTAETLSVQVTGTDGEAVKVCVAQMLSDFKLVCKVISFGSASTQKLSFDAGDSSVVAFV